MELPFLEWSNVFWYALLLFAGLITGYILAAGRFRHANSLARRELNKRSLELLGAKNTLASLQNQVPEQSRKDRLLALTLRKLQHSNTVTQEHKDSIEVLRKRHNVEITRLRLSLIQSRKAAVEAREIAQIATDHLKQVEQASPATQTIEAHEPKSYGAGEAVTVSVIDQAKPNATSNKISRVSNRDSQRLRKLRSSNEAAASSA